NLIGGEYKSLLESWVVSDPTPFTVMTGWPKIAALRERLLAGENLDPSSFRVFTLEIEELLKSEVGQSDPILQDVIKRAEEHLPQLCQGTEPISEEEKQRIIASCDEIRMRFFSLMLATLGDDVGNGADDLRDRISKGELDTQRPTIARGSGGVVYSHFESAWALLLPNIRSKAHCDLVLDDLLKIYHACSDRPRWVVDFSGVHNTPMLLLGSLAGYKAFRKKPQVLLCWLKDGLLPEGSMEGVSRIFNCHKVGGYWFSR
ncbi:hypothetical protein OAO01_06980, partial [Oligoflexia bacterium]|nr:hypothetical protein [Oligoflexia bacterium]